MAYLVNKTVNEILTNRKAAPRRLKWTGANHCQMAAIGIERNKNIHLAARVWISTNALVEAPAR
jgi:hypothetical protein